MPSIPSRFAQYLIAGGLLLTLNLFHLLIIVNIDFIYQKLHYLVVVGKEVIPLLVSISMIFVVSLVVSLGLIISIGGSYFWSIRDAFILNEEFIDNKWFGESMEFLKDRALQFEMTMNELKNIIEYWDLLSAIFKIFRNKGIKNMIGELRNWRLAKN